MKSCILALIAILASVSSFSQDFGVYKIGTKLSKDECMDRIDEWVSLNLSSYKLNVDYKNQANGKTIIKGRTVDTHSTLTSVSRGVVIPYIDYTLIVESKDSLCTLTFDRIEYQFVTGGYVDYNRLSTYTLEIIRDELVAMEAKGDKIVANQRLVNECTQIQEERESYLAKANDESLKKKERKEAQRLSDNLRGKESVLSNVSIGSSLFMHSIWESVMKILN